MKKAEMLLENSINSRLCCHCGICAGVCPTHAIMIEKNALSVDIDKCVDCGLCVNCCPAGGYELSDLTLEDIKDIPMYSAAAKDKDVSADASSGGFVTQTLLTLLAMGEITKAAVVVTGDNLDESCAKYVLTDDPAEILRARRSKYTQATINEVIEYIKNHEGRYAIVGVPCQLYGITQAINKNSVLRKRVIYKLGVVCGYTYDEDCIDGLLKVMGLERQTVHRILGWREGGLPGSFSVELEDGSVRSLPFSDEHSVDVTYYAQNRCKLCRDCLCEHGDVVSADIGGWKEKRTLVLARSSQGQHLLNVLENVGTLTIEKCAIPFEKTVLPFMLREKRSKVDIRIQKRKERSPIWIGGYSPKLLLSQKLETILSAQYERKAIKSRESHSADQMLRIGHRAYHQISSLFILKVLFKLQVYGDRLVEKLCSIKGAICYKLRVKIAGKRKTPQMLKAAIIGLGRWGNQYLGFLSSSSKYELVAAYDSDLERLRGYAKNYGFSAASSIDDLCVNYGAEVVFVLTPTPSHQDVFEKVSQYGFPVYVEKPISANLASAEEMIATSSEKNCLLYVAHSMKYEPAIQKIKSLLQDDVLGKVLSFEITRSVKSRTDHQYKNAALYQIGVHIIDVMLFLFGLPDCVVRREIISSDDKNYEHTAIKMRDGSIGKLNYGFSDVYTFSLRIRGEKATLTYADSKLTVYTDNKKNVMIIRMENEKTVFCQMDEFYFAVKKKQPYLNTAENAVEIVKICEEIIDLGE